jgi:uncharacterized protein (DUF111 family)
VSGSDLAAPAGGGARSDPDADADAGQPVSVLEANVDDATGEQLAHAVGALLEAGAHDAWLAPVVMKKGRPGTVVHVLCDPAMVAELRGILRESTGTLGVRVTTGERWPAARSIESVWIDGQLIRIKVSAGRVKAEHDDVALAARRTGQTLREVAFQAEALWRSNHHGPRMMTVTPDRGGGRSDGDPRVDRGWTERSPSPLDGDDGGNEPA